MVVLSPFFVIRVSVIGQHWLLRSFIRCVGFIKGHKVAVNITNLFNIDPGFLTPFSIISTFNVRVEVIALSGVLSVSRPSFTLAWVRGTVGGNHQWNGHYLTISFTVLLQACWTMIQQSLVDGGLPVWFVSMSSIQQDGLFPVGGLSACYLSASGRAHRSLV